VIFLAESPGFEHLHIHVVPRLPDLPADRTGIGVMNYLSQPESEWVSHADMDQVSQDIRNRLEN
jgi:hypothetical protein